MSHLRTSVLSIGVSVAPAVSEELSWVPRARRPSMNQRLHRFAGIASGRRYPLLACSIA